MTTESFTQAARQPITDDLLDTALTALGDSTSPQFDEARFTLYLAAIDRAKAGNNAYPDLPPVIAAACDRVLDGEQSGLPEYKGIFIPREVSMAYMRLQIEEANATGDKRRAIAFLSGLAALRGLDP